jgi:hypothetical protein
MGTFVHTIQRDPPFNQIVSSGAELYWMTVKLRILLKTCFLRELAFSAEKVHSFFEKNDVYQHLSQIVRHEQSKLRH